MCKLSVFHRFSFLSFHSTCICLSLLTNFWGDLFVKRVFCVADSIFCSISFLFLALNTNLNVDIAFQFPVSVSLSTFFLFLAVAVFLSLVWLAYIFSISFCFVESIFCLFLFGRQICHILKCEGFS